MITNLFTLGIRYKPQTIFIVVLVTLFAAAGMSRLQVDTSFDSLIPYDDPERVVYQRVMNEFGSDNRTIIYIRDAGLWSPGKLGSLERLHKGLASLPEVDRADGLFSLRTIEGVEGRVDSQPLLATVPDTQNEALAARDRALQNPLYAGNYFSPDGTVTAIILSVSNEEERDDFNRDVYEGVESLLDAHRADFEEIFQVGPPRIHAELTGSLFDDFLLLGPLSALVLVLAILFFMRSGLSAALPLVTSGIAIVWTFGLLGWTGVPLNILSAMIPALIIVIGSTEDTHIMAAFFRGIEEGNGDARDRGIHYMAKHIGLPLVLTVLTTTLGFASNLFSNIGLIQQFAFAASFAMLANGFITILVAPMLLKKFGVDERPPMFDTGEVHGIPGRVIRTFRIIQDRHPMSTLAITAALSVFFIYQASHLSVTNDPLSYFPEDRPLIQQTQKIHEDLSGIRIFFITLDAETERAFMDPGNIAKLAEIQEFMDRQGAFDLSISLADHLKFVNREFRGEFGEMSLPETRQLVAQYLMFFHRSDLDTYVNNDYSSANILVRHNISDSHTLNEYITELQDVVEHVAGPELDATIIGENLMVNRAAESLMVGQVKALSILLILIFLIMSAMFTSFKGGAIALIPAVVPIGLMFGIMGLFGISLNPGTAMVAVIAVGIAIDGTIHLLARYNELCRTTSDYVGAVHQAVQEEATPLIVSSLALAFGFGILLLSNFTVVAQFGALAAATMVFSLLANLLITPIIMTRIRLVGLYQILAMSVDREVLERSALFNGMNEYERRKAVVISEMHEFEAGERLIEQDTYGRSMYLILAGEAEVVRRDDGSSRQLAVLEPGQVFGEVGYIQPIKRTADVQALTEVTALRFDYERMAKDLRFFPNIVAKLNSNISAILGNRLAEMVEKSR